MSMPGLVFDGVDRCTQLEPVVRLEGQQGRAEITRRFAGGQQVGLGLRDQGTRHLRRTRNV